MGAFFTNYHLRGTDVAAAAQATADLIATRAYLSPVKDGWITLYDETSESQDTAEITCLARELSQHLNTAVFAFLIYDSDVFIYYLFDHGELIDEYNSDPAYFGDVVSEETRHRLAGQPPTVLKYCPADTTLLEVESAMGWTQSSSEGGFATGVFAEDRLRPLAAALGIDEVRAMLGYSYFEQERLALADGAQFIPIPGKNARPTKRGPVPPRLPPR